MTHIRGWGVGVGVGGGGRVTQRKKRANQDKGKLCPNRDIHLEAHNYVQATKGVNSVGLTSHVNKGHKQWRPGSPKTINYQPGMRVNTRQMVSINTPGM